MSGGSHGFHLMQWALYPIREWLVTPTTLVPLLHQLSTACTNNGLENVSSIKEMYYLFYQRIKQDKNFISKNCKEDIWQKVKFFSGSAFLETQICAFWTKDCICLLAGLFKSSSHIRIWGWALTTQSEAQDSFALRIKAQRGLCWLCFLASLVWCGTLWQK